ncbi:MAG: hypothetical protein IKX86_02055 [Clostridia bacterium]|nr:hypothetical protein [Clostridia bacterium]
MNEQIDYVPKGLRIFGKILKWIFISACVAVFLWLCLRVIWQKGPSSVRNYYMTQSAYDASEGRPHVYERNVYNTTELEKPFHATKVVTTKETSGLQIAVYFNVNSVPSADPGKFSFRLVSDDKNETALPVAVVTANAVMYRHFRIVFENVDLSADKLILEILYDGELFDSCVALLNDGYEREISLGASERRIRNEAD